MQMVELLVAHGANLNAKSVLEETPLGETRVLLLLLFLPLLSNLFMRDTQVSNLLLPFRFMC